MRESGRRGNPAGAAPRARFGRGALLAALTACAAAACAAPDAPRVGSAAPALAARSLSGESVSLASFRGAPVLLNLWATWCQPCRRETPYLEALHRRYRDRGLVVLGVSVDGPGFGREVRDFVREFGLTYTILEDPEMTAMERYAVPGLPATFLLDRDGILRKTVTGPLAPGDEAFEKVVREVVQ